MRGFRTCYSFEVQVSLLVLISENAPFQGPALPPTLSPDEIGGQTAVPFRPIVSDRSQTRELRIDLASLADEALLVEAWENVRRNRGAPGVDGVTTAAFESRFALQIASIQSEIISGAYRPSPVLAIELPKPTGGVRVLGIPTVRLHHGRLAVFSKRDDDPSDDLLQEIPIEGLESVSLREHVQITTEALGVLMRARIPVHYLDVRGDLLGSILPPSGEISATRLRQYRRSLDPAFVQAGARAIVEAKIGNQLRLLQRLHANRPELPAPDVESLARHREALVTAAGLDELRGREGASAAVFYPAWEAFLPPEFPFERRSIRPPHNPVNAILSYAYTLIYRDLVSAIHVGGLDPGLGLLHVPEDGRWSLALDLMEPFRPVLGDALAIRLLGHRILQAEHFEPHEGGIYLTREGRRELIVQYEERLDRPFVSEQLGHRTTLRQCFVDQVVRFKTSLQDGSPTFEPFRLN